MPETLIPAIVEFALHGKLGDDTNVINTFYGLLTDGVPPTITDLHTAAVDFAGLWASAFLSHLSSGYSLTGVSAKDRANPDGAFVNVGITPAPGSVGGDACPANVAACISWVDGLSYRGGHPRTYLPGVPAAEITDPQHFTTAWQSAVLSAANSFISSVAAHTWPSLWAGLHLAAVHFKLDKIVQTPPAVHQIIAANMDTRIDSQRRRLRR